jgi:IS5 family transposase
MRQKHTTQGSIFWFQPEHEICDYLNKVDSWLNLHPELLDWVSDDLGHQIKGRLGLSYEQVLRAALVMKYRQCSYRGLSFMLADSLSFQYFARIDPFRVPGKSALHANISRIKNTTWEKMNQLFVRDMIDGGFEPGDRLRIDSTVAESHILSPTDSKLLYDCQRIMVRLLKRSKRYTHVKYVNHCRRAKSNYFAVQCARDSDSRYRLYKVMLKDVDETRVSLCNALEVLKTLGDQAVWVKEIEALLPLVAQAMDQTTRRVIEGESVPAEEKVVSMYEDHADIIKKGGRKVQYGHKINLTSGRSGLVYDVVIEEGNPADRIRLLPMLERHKEIYGTLPDDIAADGGYASKDNLTSAKAMGIDNVAFHKRVGLEIADMTGDVWLFRELRNFRAGIEAGISYLKRCFGLKRIVWKGWDRFCASIHLSIFTHNLILWARAA